MFARHLPPSAGLPRVLVLAPAAAAELAGLIQMVLAAPSADDWPAGPFDAIAGPAAPEQLPALGQRLRPGGRLILTHAAAPEALLAAMTAAGLIHCLVEPHGPVSLYRGERPPAGTTLERHQALAQADWQPTIPTSQIPTFAPDAAAGVTNYQIPTLAPDAVAGVTAYLELPTPFIFLLIQRTPNKPAWKLAPGEPVTWRAATLISTAGAPPVLLGFSSLVKAVAYMQGAVMARQLAGVNKVGKFPAQAMRAWPLPLALNADFAAVSVLEAGPPFEVDPRTAITGDE